jgi:hypothetical protein
LAVILPGWGSSENWTASFLSLRGIKLGGNWALSPLAAVKSFKTRSNVTTDSHTRDSKAEPTSNRIKCTLLHTSADPETRDFEGEQIGNLEFEKVRDFSKDDFQRPLDWHSSGEATTEKSKPPR